MASINARYATPRLIPGLVEQSWSFETGTIRISCDLCDEQFLVTEEAREDAKYPITCGMQPLSACEDRQDSIAERWWCTPLDAWYNEGWRDMWGDDDWILW